MYIGEMDSISGLPHGEGSITFTDCRYYKGTWKKGKVHGFGVLGSQDGRRCEGELKDGRWEGKITTYTR